MRFWAGPWLWDAAAISGPCWDAPAQALPIVDLRSTPQCAATETPEGFGIFSTANAVNLGSDYTLLCQGDPRDETLTQQQKNRFASALGLPQALAANTVAGAVWEVLTRQADPTGDDRAPPLLPTSRRRHYELWIRGNLVEKKFKLGDPEETPAFDLLKRIYRQLRQQVIDEQAPANLHRKWLGFQLRKFGFRFDTNDYRRFQPADVPDEPPLAPETTITESFNTADSTTLGPDLTWTEVRGDWSISSNQCTHANAAGQALSARADYDLSSDDHYSQVVLASGSGAYLAVVCFRFSASAETYYRFLIRLTDGVNQIQKCVTGTITNLVTGTAAGALSLPGTQYGESDGTTLVGKWAGVQRATVTDSAISGHTRCGIGTNAATPLFFDDFEAADIGAPSTEFPPLTGSGAVVAPSASAPAVGDAPVLGGAGSAVAPSASAPAVGDAPVLGGSGAAVDPTASAPAVGDAPVLGGTGAVVAPFVNPLDQIVDGTTCEYLYESQSGGVVLPQSVDGTTCEYLYESQSGSVVLPQIVDGVVAEVLYAAQSGSIESGAVVAGTVAEILYEAQSGTVTSELLVSGTSAEIQYGAQSGGIVTALIVDGDTAEYIYVAVSGSIDIGSYAKTPYIEVLGSTHRVNKAITPRG